VTSDSTALMAIRTEVSTGRPTLIKLSAAIEVGATLRPTTRPTTRNSKTGIPIVPNAPSGSRRNILISIHVNFQSPCSIVIESSVANRVTSQFEKDVLKVRKNCAEFCYPEPVLGQTVNHFGHEIVAVTSNRELRVAADDHLDSRDRSKA